MASIQIVGRSLGLPSSTVRGSRDPPRQPGDSITTGRRLWHPHSHPVPPALTTGAPSRRSQRLLTQRLRLAPLGAGHAHRPTWARPFTLIGQTPPTHAPRRVRPEPRSSTLIGCFHFRSLPIGPPVPSQPRIHVREGARARALIGLPFGRPRPSTLRVLIGWRAFADLPDNP